jgi:hypothetical protein
MQTARDKDPTRSHPLCRAVFSLFAKTMRAKRGHLEDGGAEHGVSGETPSRIVFADKTGGARERGLAQRPYGIMSLLPNG